jgi:hypothetical protein
MDMHIAQTIKIAALRISLPAFKEKQAVLNPLRKNALIDTSNVLLTIITSGKQ